jgi:hypothetical protein
VLDCKDKNILNILTLFILILDSGGGLSIRSIAILIIMYNSIKGFYNYSKKIEKDFFKYYFFFLITIFSGILFAVINHASFVKIFNYVLVFFLIPIFYFYVKGSKLKINDFVYAGFLFSILVIIIFFGRFYDIGVIKNLNDYIQTHSDGFFGNKSFISGDILPNVYFQGTLSLVISGILSLKEKKYIVYISILLSLILAPSRFGFLLLIIWLIFLFLRRYKFGILLIVLFSIFSYNLLFEIPFIKEVVAVFNGETDSISIRDGHVISILKIFATKPLSFIFGSGPGTIFFTVGTSSYTDNIEISQLEFVRKYGIISFIVFLIFYFRPLFYNVNNSLYVKGALLFYFIVSLSNPVLFSIFSMLFLTFSYIELNPNNKKL